jgi:signal transduction histidine kinase
MKKYWQTISNLGIDEKISIFNRKRLKLLNQIALLSIAISFIHTIAGLIFGDFYTAFYSIVVFSFMFPALWLNAKKQYYTGKVFAVIGFYVLTCSLTILYGWEAAGKVFLLYSFFSTFILFDKKNEYIFFSSLNALLLFTCSAISSFQEPVIVSLYIEYIVYVAIAFFTYLTLTTFKSEQEHKEKEAQSLINSMNNKNEALSTQRRLVRYRNEALKKANDELKDAEELLKASNEDLRTFAYIVSHDLKEPLRMINSYTQLLKRRIGNNLDEDSEQFMFFIIDGSLRMKVMLDDLLQYATAANKNVFKEPIHIKDAIEVAVKNLEITIKEKKANIEWRAIDIPTIDASFSHIVQLFQNLIGNAVKFQKPGILPLVEISSETKGKYHIIRVQDNGIGIPREKTDSIFSPFERVGHNKIKGTGIGLAICKKIVENHNGKIWVESDLNEGATFFIAFPIKEDVVQEEMMEEY